MEDAENSYLDINEMFEEVCLPQEIGIALDCVGDLEDTKLVYLF